MMRRQIMETLLICYVLLCLVEFSAQFGSFGVKIPPIKIDDDWPFDVILLDASTKVNPKYGNGKLEVIKDREDENKRKIVGHITLDKDLDCISLRGRAIAYVETNGMRIKNFELVESPFNIFITTLIDVGKSFMDAMKLPKECPVKAGTYTMDKFSLNPKYLPRMLPENTYIVQIYILSGLDQVAEMEFTGKNELL